MTPPPTGMTPLPTSIGALPSWEELINLLVPAGKLMELTWYPHDVPLRADLYRQLLMNVALGYFVYFQSDPDHPDWTPFLNSVFLLQPNPDDTYFLAHVRGSGIYRISGERGSVRLLTFSTGARMMGMSGTPGQGYEQYDADELKLAADGSFEVIMSHERPADARGVGRLSTPTPTTSWCGSAPTIGGASATRASPSSGWIAPISRRAPRPSRLPRPFVSRQRLRAAADRNVAQIPERDAQPRRHKPLRVCGFRQYRCGEHSALLAVHFRT